MKITKIEIKMEQKNKNFKKSAIALCFTMLTCLIHAQIDIKAYIAKVKSDSIVTIYTSITNLSEDSVYILDRGWITDDGIILREGSSCATFYAYSSNLSLIGKSDCRPLSSTDNIKTIIKLEKGKTHIVKSLLYDIRSTRSMMGIFDNSFRPNLKYLEAKIRLKYFTKSMTSFQEIEIMTNKLEF